jgi:hypothetical protein
VNVSDLAGTNLVAEIPAGNPTGAGKLKVDLTNYNGNVTIFGTLTATNLTERPLGTDDVLELRYDTSTKLADDGFAGMVIHGVVDLASEARLGVNGAGNAIFKNKTDSYLLPLLKKPTTKYDLIGVTENGIVTETKLKTITLKVRANDKTTTYDKTQTIDLLSTTAPEVELIIPKKLSDLEDYNEDIEGPNYVSENDRLL